MAEILFKSAFVLGFILQISTRAPHGRVRQKTRVATDWLKYADDGLSAPLFGADHRTYMSLTGRVFPRLGK